MNFVFTIVAWILGGGACLLLLAHVISTWVAPLRNFLRSHLYISRIGFCLLSLAVLGVEVGKPFGGSEGIRLGAWAAAALAFGALYYLRESRRIEMGRWLAKSDLEYMLGVSNTLHKTWPDASVFRGAPSGITVRPFRGVRSGREVRLFDFNEGWRHRHLKGLIGPEQCVTVALVPLEGRVAGRVVIRPEGAKDAIASATGLSDINFESHEFSRVYHVSASDRKLAYAAVTPRAMQCLVRGKPVYVEVAGNAITVTLGHRKLAMPDECARLLEVAGEFAAAMPEFLVERVSDGEPRGHASR